MRSFIFALQHLTRIHIGNVAFDKRQLGRSGMFFPLVGLILGGLLAALDHLAGMAFPPMAATAAVLVGLVALTGGIHLDGFMDTVDGVFSGRPRERKLEIMKDSRVGAFGVLGVFCLLLFKYGLLTGLAGPGGYTALIMMTVFGRWSMTYAIARFPYARNEGMGKLYKLHTGSFELAVATATALAIALAAGKTGGLLIFALSALFAHFLCSYLNRVLGGLTGDTYGFLNESTEVFALAVCLCLEKI
ncbi:MAG: adenosylcobinamide-GDP ribazoletransferase [Bacillota bacterium]